jgi:hypothetical protein
MMLSILGVGSTPIFRWQIVVMFVVVIVVIVIVIIIIVGTTTTTTIIIMMLIIIININNIGYFSVVFLMAASVAQII